MKLTIALSVIVLLGFAFVYHFGTHVETLSIYGLFTSAFGGAYSGFVLIRLATSLQPRTPVRGAWMWLAVGLWIWGFTSIMELFEMLVLHLRDYATLADIFAVSGYIPVAGGLIQMRTTQPLQRRPMVALLLLMFAGYILLFSFYILPQLRQSDRDIGTNILDFLYPTLDFVLIAICAFLVQRRRNARGERAAVYGLLLCGFGLPLAADLALFLQNDAQNSPLYDLLDVPYFLSFILIAMAAHLYAKFIASTSHDS